MIAKNIEVPKQVCMTKDNVNVELTSVIYYHVTSPHKAAFGITNLRQALVERTQTTLRHVVGARVLQDIIERREEIATSISEIVEDLARSWGCEISAILIKDIYFSTDLQNVSVESWIIFSIAFHDINWTKFHQGILLI